MRLRSIAVLLLWTAACAGCAFASNVPVRFQEGLVHGFILLTTMDGNALAQGDLFEVAHGSQVTTHLVLHFKDGSLQEETTVFSQRNSFSLISYRMIQKGPAFPHPTDISIVTSTGQVTVRYTDDKGKEKVESERMKLPPDIANGLLPILLKNVRSGEAIPQFPVVVATPKPRIVKLNVSSSGTEPFSIAGSTRQAIHYVVKVEIGGVTGVVAPLLGKEPPDAHVWIIGGEAPSFVKSETLSYMGGPLWRTLLVSPEWPHSESKNAGAAKP